MSDLLGPDGDDIHQRRSTDRADSIDLAVEVRALAVAIGDLDKSYKAEQAAASARLSEVEAGRRADSWAIRLLVVTLAALLVLGLGVRATLTNLEDIAEGNRENGDAIMDCAIPVDELAADQADRLTAQEAAGNRCFENTQARTAAAVAAIVRCSRLPAAATAAEVDSCVSDRMRADR